VREYKAEELRKKEVDPASVAATPPRTTTWQAVNYFQQKYVDNIERPMSKAQFVTAIAAEVPQRLTSSAAIDRSCWDGTCIVRETIGAAS
jgi:hypothetical protein